MKYIVLISFDYFHTNCCSFPLFPTYNFSYYRYYYFYFFLFLLKYKTLKFKIVFNQFEIQLQFVYFGLLHPSSI